MHDGNWEETTESEKNQILNKPSLFVSMILCHEDSLRHIQDTPSFESRKNSIEVTTLMRDISVMAQLL